jgi:hypothetical protein
MAVVRNRSLGATHPTRVRLSLHAPGANKTATARRRQSFAGSVRLSDAVPTTSSVAMQHYVVAPRSCDGTDRAIILIDHAH